MRLFHNSPLHVRVLSKLYNVREGLAWAAYFKHVILSQPTSARPRLEQVVRRT